MNIKKIKLNLLLLITFLSFNAHAEFDEMVVFGDSLSDTGNLASTGVVFPSPPFYAASRVSNGPVAVEGLADKLGLSAEASMHLVGGAGGSNFSVAGARARPESDFPIDLGDQVGAYLLQVGGIASENTLYVVFIGGNDVRDARGVSHKQSKVILGAAAKVIDQQLRLLIAAGAQHILVANSPDIGSIPETHLLAAATNNKHLVRQTKRRSKQFNRILARKIRAIERDTDQDLVLFDVFAYLQKILRNSVAYGYSNTNDACFSTANDVFNSECEFGQRFSEHLFFDEIHPTGRSHERVSRALYAEVPEG